MVTLARAGKRVVRLKGGDPMIFGRATEEIAACRAAGIAVEVVPGISAAQGAASRLGVSAHPPGARAASPIRHRPRFRRPSAGRLDWRSIADPSATTIVYMPVKRTPPLRPPRSRPALIRNPRGGGDQRHPPDETSSRPTIADLPQHLAATPFTGPRW